MKQNLHNLIKRFRTASLYKKSNQARSIELFETAIVQFVAQTLNISNVEAANLMLQNDNSIEIVLNKFLSIK